MSFDYAKFLRERWGDPDRLIAFLHAYDHKDIKRPTVNQWFRRRSIPAEHFATLLTLLEIENGAPVSTAEYLK